MAAYALAYAAGARPLDRGGAGPGRRWRAPGPAQGSPRRPRPGRSAAAPPAVPACPSRVRLRAWSVSRRAASAQSPAACRWPMASAAWPCSASHCAASRCSSGDVPRARAAQFQPEQAAEHAVVAEPGTAGVEGHDERVGVLQVQQDPFRPCGAGEQVGQLAVDPVQQRRCAAAGPGPPAAAAPASRPSGTRRPCGRCRRTRRRTVRGRGARRGTARRAAARPPSPRSAGAACAATCSGSAIPAAASSCAGLVLGEAQLRGADLGQLTGQPQLVQAAAAGRGGWPRSRGRRGAGASAAP